MRSYQMSESGREALPKAQEGSGGPPGGPKGIERPSQRSGKGREVLPKVRA